MSVEGTLAPEFARVREVFSAKLTAGDDLGAGIAVMIDGECVVDLRGGFRDRQKSSPFGDALTCVYSSGKAVTAALVLIAVERGQLRYDQPIAELWPEFSANGKDDISLGDALSHQSGVPVIDGPVERDLWLDWEATCQRLAAMAPVIPPRSQSAYGPQTYGYIVGETYRRATGDTIGAALRALGMDVFCGVTGPTTERVGRMVKPPAAPSLGTITPLKQAAFLERWSNPGGVDPATWMAAEIPASNMHATARALAEVMQVFAVGALLGQPVVSDATRNTALAERIRGDDLVLPFDLSWAAGVMQNPHGDLGPSATAVGHYGFGGSCLIADPTHRLSFAYVPNKMSPALVGDPRAIAYLNAVYDCL